MKKTALLLCVLLIGVCAFAQNGVVRELSGTVELKARGAQDYTAARQGDTVAQDTIVSTGFKSTALIEVGSTLITVRPLTRLSLTEISAAAGAETLNVNLQAGRVRVDVNPPAGTRASTAVSSPIATASVRGTSFEFDTRNIHVSHGTVSFAGNRGASIPMLVNAGSTSRIEANGRAADPVTVKIENYQPPAPVGTDATASVKSESLGQSAGVTIELIYE